MEIDLEKMFDRLIAPPFVAAACFFCTGVAMYIGGAYNSPGIMFSSMGFFIGGAATAVIHFLGKKLSNSDNFQVASSDNSSVQTTQKPTIQSVKQKPVPVARMTVLEM